MDLLNEDAQLASVLAFQAHHAEAETSRQRLLQLHVGHMAALDHIRILLMAASKLTAAVRSLFEVPQEERTQLVVSESHHTLTMSRYLVWVSESRLKVICMFYQSMLMSGNGNTLVGMCVVGIGCTKSRTSFYLSHGENDVFKSFRRCLANNVCGSRGFWVGSRAAIGLDYGGVIRNFNSTGHW